MKDYAWPQGTPCPAPEKGKDYSIFSIPAGDRQNSGSKPVEVRIPKARDFSEYKYKYFTLTSKTNIFTAVCVKECPKAKYVAKKEKGKCVKKDGTPAVIKIDYNQATAKDLEACRNQCFQDKRCNAYELIGTQCQTWIDSYDAKTLLWKEVDPPKGDGSATGTCYIKDKASMTEVAYLKNDDEDGMTPALPG